ncbi:hypothetical protein MKW98_005394 [Papaver atlanticum]|uniref:No apical meristem-associated C-terminal domain-containing protein n=1 Tax=Papaver atlanticum TaxID=357466 RepID=A0AAD4RX90_9MAGN|nr:hypothetical protein MKW98_005394 [Papaver atlanticum]
MFGNNPRCNMVDSIRMVILMKYGIDLGFESSDDDTQNALILCQFMKQEAHRLHQAEQVSTRHAANMPGCSPEDIHDPPVIQRAQTSASQVPYDEGSRRFYEKGKKRQRTTDGQKREKAGALSANDGLSNVISYLEEQNALRMAKYDERLQLFRRLVETEKQAAEAKMRETDSKILEVDIETLPEWNRGAMLAMQNEVLARRGFPPRG